MKKKHRQINNQIAKDISNVLKFRIFYCLVKKKNLMLLFDILQRHLFTICLFKRILQSIALNISVHFCIKIFYKIHCRLVKKKKKNYLITSLHKLKRETTINRCLICCKWIFTHQQQLLILTPIMRTLKRSESVDLYAQLSNAYNIVNTIIV